MRSSVARAVAPALALALVALPLTGQAQWEPPSEGCPLATNHFLLRSASLYLKQASETSLPQERERFLRDADRVLTEASTQIPDNTATWYFLGRYYVMTRDVIGADTAFRRAEEGLPPCRGDIARWRQGMAPHALHAGMLARQAQSTDSATRLFRLVQAMDPGDASGLIELAREWLLQEELDSAETALAAAYALEPTDSSMVRQLADVHLSILQSYRRRVATHEAVPRWDAARSQLIALERDIAIDSSALARMLGDVARIRDQGRRLDAQSLRAFQAESTSRSDRLTRARGLRDAARQAAQRDSIALAATLDPALVRYEQFVERYADRVEAAADLARLYALGGHTAGVNRSIDRLLARADSMSDQQLLQAGTALLSGGQPAGAVRMLAAGLERNPYDRNGLYLFGRAWLLLHEADSAMAAAERLRGVDPHSDQTLRLLALVWQEREEADSAGRYVALADSGLRRLVVITQFSVADGNATLGGTVRNRGAAPLPAARLTVEFLSRAGEVVAAESVDVPALEPGAYHAWTVRAEGRTIIAWRYRVS